jgi:tetraacyldisaccharide-1-P 4'-kinase
VFRTRLLARTWRDAETGQPVEVVRQRVGAFCGLGNPQNFWNTLESLGLNLVFRWSFDDHHTYRPVELRYLASQAILHGAELLVTTEKDRMNLLAHSGKSVAPLRLAWLEIDLELADSATFFSFLEARLHSMLQTEPEA